MEIGEAEMTKMMMTGWREGGEQSGETTIEGESLMLYTLAPTEVTV